MTTHWELIQARVTELFEDGEVGIEMLDKNTPTPGGR